MAARRRLNTRPTTELTPIDMSDDTTTPISAFATAANNTATIILPNNNSYPYVMGIDPYTPPLFKISKNTIGITHPELIDPPIDYEKMYLDEIKEALQGWYPDRWDIQDGSNLKYKILIHFPSINITNTAKQSHHITDLFVKLEFDIRSHSKGKIPVPTFSSTVSGLRTSFSKVEYAGQYKHSHLPLGNCSQWGSFCMGDAPLKYDILSLATGEYSLLLFEAMLLDLDNSMRWESTEGVPHCRMGDIENYAVNNLGITREDRVRSQDLENNFIRFINAYDNFPIEYIPTQVGVFYVNEINEEFKHMVSLIATHFEGENNSTPDFSDVTLHRDHTNWEILFRGQRIKLKFTDNDKETTTNTETQEQRQAHRQIINYIAEELTSRCTINALRNA